mgnify:CR=1 FL=1
MFSNEKKKKVAVLEENTSFFAKYLRAQYKYYSKKSNSDSDNDDDSDDDSDSDSDSELSGTCNSPSS